MDTLRHILTRAGLLALLLIWSSLSQAANEIRGFVLTVSDLDRAVAFYEKAFDFRKVAERVVSDPEHDRLVGVFGTRVRSARLQLGGEFIELEQYVSPAGQSVAPDSRSNDLWFQHFAIVVADMDRAWAHLQAFPIRPVSSAPQTIPASNIAAAGIRAVKFRDPDGHPLELLWFPADKGNPKWQDAAGRLFLGIDHSAITIEDTQRSSAFWRDLVGLRVAGGSLNSGPTQEQLDNAFGAVVRITGLRPQRDAGPGLEFLQYLTPTGGRAASTPLRPNDVVATRTVVEVDDVDAIAQRMQSAGVRFVSPAPTPVSGAPWSRGLIVHDPDGHLVLLVEP